MKYTEKQRKRTILSLKQERKRDNTDRRPNMGKRMRNKKGQKYTLPASSTLSNPGMKAAPNAVSQHEQEPIIRLRIVSGLQIARFGCIGS